MYLYAEEIAQKLFTDYSKHEEFYINYVADLIMNNDMYEDRLQMTPAQARKEKNKIKKKIKQDGNAQALRNIATFTDFLKGVIKKVFGNYNYNPKQIDVKKLINKSWKGKKFSDRIWNNERATAYKLYKDLKRFIDGEISANKIKSNIYNTFGNSKFNTRRLVKTEVARVSNNAFEVFGREMGVKEVRYNAAFDHTCPQCSKRHGEVYKFKDRPELPAHPQCNCFYEVYDYLKDDKEDNKKNDKK